MFLLSRADSAGLSPSVASTGFMIPNPLLHPPSQAKPSFPQQLKTLPRSIEPATISDPSPTPGQIFDSRLTTPNIKTDLAQPQLFCDLSGLLRVPASPVDFMTSPSTGTPLPGVHNNPPISWSLTTTPTFDHHSTQMTRPSSQPITSSHGVSMPFTPAPSAQSYDGAHECHRSELANHSFKIKRESDDQPVQPENSSAPQKLDSLMPRTFGYEPNVDSGGSEKNLRPEPTKPKRKSTGTKTKALRLARVEASAAPHGLDQWKSEHTHEQPGQPVKYASITPGGYARRYACAWEGCGKAFTTSGHLARHHRIHTGEKRYECVMPNCRSRFSRQDNMLQHYRTHLSGKSRRLPSVSSVTSSNEGLMRKVSGDVSLNFGAIEDSPASKTRGSFEEPAPEVSAELYPSENSNLFELDTGTVFNYEGTDTSACVDEISTYSSPHMYTAYTTQVSPLVGELVMFDGFESFSDHQQPTLDLGRSQAINHQFSDGWPAQDQIRIPQLFQPSLPLIPYMPDYLQSTLLNYAHHSCSQLGDGHLISQGENYIQQGAQMY